jgi:hypothetical protein
MSHIGHGRLEASPVTTAESAAAVDGASAGKSITNTLLLRLAGLSKHYTNKLKIRRHGPITVLRTWRFSSSLSVGAATADAIMAKARVTAERNFILISIECELLETFRASGEICSIEDTV